MALTKAHNRMIADAAVNVKDFGAVGDGVTDDTAAIQAALTYLNANGGKLTLSGNFYVNAVLEITANNVTIEGDGFSSGITFPYDATTMRRLKITGNSVHLANFYIQENGVTARTGVYGSISGEGANDLRIDNIGIDGSSATGIHLINCQRTIIKNCKITSTWADGIHVQRGSKGFIIEGNQCLDNGDDAIGIVSHAYNTYGFAGKGVIANNRLGNTTDGKPGSGVALVGAIRVIVDGNTIENTALSGIRVAEFFDASEGDAVSGNHLISNNIIHGGGTGSYTSVGVVKHGISVFNSRNVKVDSNVLFNSYSNGIVLSQGIINVEVTNNIIDKCGGRGIWTPISNMTGNYLRLWTDSEFNDGESQAYVRGHYIRIENNTVKRPQLDGIYADGGSAQIYESVVTGNMLYDINSSASGSGTYAIFTSQTTDLLLSNNYLFSNLGSLSGNFISLNATDLVYTYNYPPDNAQTTYIGPARHTRGGAAPTSGTYAIGDVVWNWNPASGVLCFVCTAAGTPGTWATININ